MLHLRFALPVHENTLRQQLQVEKAMILNLPKESNEMMINNCHADQLVNYQSSLVN